MNSFVIFYVIASILTMAVYSSTNFALAASECFGEGLDHFLCIGTTTLSNGEVSTWVYECVKDKDGHWDCHSITKTNVIPPGLKNEIDATVRGEEQSNPNDSKDLGGLKNDNTNRGTDLSPESAQSSADGTNSSISKYNKSSTLTQLNDLQVARGLH